MSPKNHNEEDSKNHKQRLVSFKHNRPRTCTNAASKSQPNKNAISKSATHVKHPENYENLLLFYLNKLKSLFSNVHPEPAARENSAIKMNKLHHDHNLRSSNRASSVAHPYRYTSSNPPKPREYQEEDVHSKVYKVVTAALEYGFANNVLAKKGDYFLLKNRHQRMSPHRQTTPCPRYCQQCCSIHQCLKNEMASESYPGAKFSQRREPMRSYFDRPLHTIQQGKVDRNHRHRPHSMCFHRHYRNGTPQNLAKVSEERLAKNIAHCPDCRALEHVRK